MGQSSSSHGSDFLSSPNAILDVSRTLVPLLLQCWGEVNLPSQGKSPRGRGSLTIGPNEEETMKCVVAILQTVWVLMERACEEKGDQSPVNELRKSYQRKIEQHFLQGFPYSGHQHAPTRAKAKRSSSSRRGPSVGSSTAPINLTCCDLLLSVMVATGNKTRPWLKLVREFVEGILRENVREGEQQLTQQDQLLLMGVVRKLLEQTHDEDERESLIDAVFLFYERAHPLSQQKLRGLKTLTSIWLDGTKPSESNVSPRCSKFFQSLGRLMMEGKDSSHGIVQEALHTLLVAAARGHADAVDCITQHFPDWLGGERAIVDSLDQTTQQRLMECVYYLPSLGSRLVKYLTKYCCSLDTDVRVPVYILVNRCFENVFGASVRPPVSYSDFTDMLLTISMGHSQDDLASLQTSITTDDLSRPVLGNTNLSKTLKPYYHILNDIPDPRQLQQASNINKMVQQVYRCHPRQDVVLRAVISRMREVLTTCQYLPMRCALSILDHAAMLKDTEATSSASWSSPTADSTRKSEGVDGLVGTVAFLVLYQTVLDRRADVERGQETVARALFGLVIESLATCSDHVIDSLLQQTCDAIKAHLSRQVGAVVTCLLQTNSLRRRLHRYSKRLLALVQDVETDPSSEKDSRWFTELKYEVNLLAREVSPNR